MAAQSFVQSTLYSRPVARTQVAAKSRLHIRKDLLVIRLMIVTGLVIPLLMASHLVAASYLLVGIAFGLIVVGGVMALIRCGEVA